MRSVFNNENKIYDSGLFYGRGVFETILVKQKPIMLIEHIQRLNRGIDVLKLGEYIQIEIVKDYIKNNKIKDKALKIVVTEKNIIFEVRDIKYTQSDYNKGFKVKISTVLRNSTSKTAYIKSLNYLENILEYEEAQKEGYNESIFFNENNILSEGCTTNIFIVKNNIIYTPKVDCGLLNGIIRNWVIKNFDIIEKEITKEELLASDEIFLTNSIVGIIKVSEIENRKLDSFISGKIRCQYEEFLMQEER